MNRAERVAYIVATLVDRPGSVLPLGYFTERLGAAKSTISEDLTLVKGALETHGLGQVRTFSGAAGGVQYLPLPTARAATAALEELCSLLQAPERVLPGGYLYMTDLIASPVWSARIGAIFAADFQHQAPTCVLTVETKGIPLALMTARALGVPMLMARRESRVTEGSSVSINYVTSSRRIQAMSLARRAMPAGARVLLIDDFMKAGGTARGMADLVRECGAEPVGIGVLIATREPAEKRVRDYISLLTLENVDDATDVVVVRPTGRSSPGSRAES